MKVCGKFVGEGEFETKGAGKKYRNPQGHAWRRAQANPSPHLRKSDERKCGEASSLQLEGSTAIYISQTLRRRAELDVLDISI